MDDKERVTKRSVSAIEAASQPFGDNTDIVMNEKRSYISLAIDACYRKARGTRPPYDGRRQVAQGQDKHSFELEAKMPRVSTTKRSTKRVVKSAGKRAARNVKTASSARAAPKRPAASNTATTAIRAPYTKAQLLATLAENTGVEKKDVAAVLKELNAVIERHIMKRAAGHFTLPGLMKIRTTRKPATRARKGRNPFTGDEIMIKAKPAHTVVKISALKGLKEMVA